MNTNDSRTGEHKTDTPGTHQESITSRVVLSHQTNPGISEGPAELSTTRQRGMAPWLRRIIGFLILGVLVGGLMLAYEQVPLFRTFMQPVVAFFGSAEEEPPGTDFSREPSVPPGPWDGFVQLTNRQAQSLGLEVRTVEPLTKPIDLDINGMTAYNPDTQAQVRPRFPSVINKVKVLLGQRVEKGDELLDLFSADLAAAKSDYEKSQAKWDHDLHELERAEKLRKTQPPAISERDYLTIVNDEKVSRTEAKVAEDKLLVYGLSQAEIENVPLESGTEKAQMKARATIDGVVVRRDAVQGNLYDTTDVLLVIAPIEKLWVYGQVYPSDAKYVKAGLKWFVKLPDRQELIPTTVVAVASNIDPDTRTLRIRGELPNDDGSVKADSLVSGYLEVPVAEGDTVLPRQAMVATDGNNYVFVLRSGEPQAAEVSDRATQDSALGLVFERRLVQVVREHAGEVILEPIRTIRQGESFEQVGVKPGDKVASRGALILSQLYEDAESSRPLAPGIPNQNGSNPTSGHLTNPHVRVTIR